MAKQGFSRGARTMGTGNFLQYLAVTILWHHESLVVELGVL